MTTPQAIEKNPFERFRVRYGLSLRALARVLNLSGKSSAARLCDGTASRAFIAAHRATIEAGARSFLTGQLLSAQGVRQELTDLFTQFSQEVEMPELKVTRLAPRVRKFFGLSKEPFPPQFSRDGDETYFESPELAEIEGAALRAIREHNLVAVLGGLGTGKTTLKKRVADAVAESDGELRLVWVHTPAMEEITAFNLIDLILSEFDETPRLSRMQRLKQLTSLLVNLDAEGKSVALAIDECHRLPARTLRSLKDFLEMIQTRRASRKRYGSYLGIVLFGQSPFQQTLRNFPELAQRTEVCEMPSVTTHAHAYLNYRAQQAGAAGELFTAAAAARLAQYARTPLALNNLANEALSQCYTAGARVVDEAGDLLDWLEGGPVRAKLRRA